MNLEIKVPDIGDFKNVEIIEVLVKEGDQIKKNYPLHLPILIESKPPVRLLLSDPARPRTHCASATAASNDWDLYCHRSESGMPSSLSASRPRAGRR